jgi:hypothetical protein
MRYVIVEEKARNEPSEMAAECSQGQARKRATPWLAHQNGTSPAGAAEEKSVALFEGLHPTSLTPGLRSGLHSAAIFDGSLSSFDLQCNLMRLVLE